jgi:hypothetical protein
MAPEEGLFPGIPGMKTLLTVGFPAIHGRADLLCLEIAGLALQAVTLLALCRIAQLALGEHLLHLDLTAAGAGELLGYDPDPRVFAQYLSHVFPPSFRLD